MNHRTAKFILGAAFACVALLSGTPNFLIVQSHAQQYPVRPIQVIVPFAGGSASDVVMRIVLDRMSKSMGHPIIVDNRPGAGGNTGTLAGAKSTPDGYTLVMSSVGPLAANRSLYKDLGYDPEHDLEPISLFAFFPLVVTVSTKLPIKTLTELIAHAKANPKQLNYGTVGIGSAQHLTGLYFEQVTGTQLTHVPYRNIAQYGPDLIAGQVPLGFQFLPNVNGPIQAGGAIPIAVTSSKRMTALPNVPTAAEAGLANFESIGWLCLMAPKGTPKPIVAKLNQELAAAVKDASVRDKVVEQGTEPVSNTPEEMSKFIVSETAKWREVIAKAGIQPIQ
jgi:tripartite-type tricarboxylate transporter receptor subunit TctC